MSAPPRLPPLNAPPSLGLDDVVSDAKRAGTPVRGRALPPPPLCAAAAAADDVAVTIEADAAPVEEQPASAEVPATGEEAVGEALFEFVPTSADQIAMKKGVQAP